MTNRSVKAQMIIRVAVVLGILVLVNVVSVRIFGRLDFTKNRLFTLSDASKELMRSLDDRVTVKAYFTEDLPSPYSNNRRTVLDQLNEYKAYARGNFHYEFINPTGEKGEQEAQQQGVMPIQAQVVKEDKFEVMRGYMGLVFLYEDKKEVLPVVSNTATLEYDISSTIKRLTSRTQKKIGFLQGHGEPTLTELQHMQELLRRQYEVMTVDLSKNAPVPGDIAALIVMAPSKAVPDAEKFQIDQYLMRDGRVAFLLNKVEGNLQTRFGKPLDVNLDDIIEAYGLRVNTDLVRDVQCASVSIVQQQFGFSMQSQVPFPYLPLASTFNKENMIAKDLQGVVFFFASSIDTVSPSAKGTKAEILVRSSKQSGRQTSYFMYDPLQRFTEADFAEKGIPLAALVTGPLTSAYSGKPVPSDPTAGAAAPVSSPLTKASNARIVLVGDGDFVRDQYLGNKDNLTFFANIVDYLVDDTGLITIRTKEAAMPPLEQVSDSAKKALKFATMVVPPLLVLAYGLFRWRVRRAQRKAMESAQ